jgi:hypothetical protein
MVSTHSVVQSSQSQAEQLMLKDYITQQAPDAWLVVWQTCSRHTALAAAMSATADA